MSVRNAAPSFALHRILIGLCFVWALLPAASLRAERNVSREYQLKAAFLYKFLGFIEWLPAPGQELPAQRVICIIGENPFGESLERLAAIQPAATIQTSVSYLSTLQDEPCHIVYISRSERKNVAALLERARQRGIPSVSDIHGFAEQGGTIELVEEAPYLRFVVNLSVLKDSPYRVSAQLLALAKELIGRSEYDAT